jgi:RNA polymerase-binding protein DksA
MRDRLVGEADHMKQTLLETLSAPGDLSNVPTHNADRDSEGVDTHLGQIANEEHLLEEIKGALDRIEQGSYGICQECGREIAHARLEALPFTPHCIDCAQKLS